MGVHPSFTPNTYSKIRPIQIGCAETPIRTNTIAVLSISDRGFRAEKIPTERPIIIQRTAPPNTSEAVTGAASLIRWLTLWLVANDSPRSAWNTSRRRNFSYCTGIGWSRPSFLVAWTRHSRLAWSPPQTARAGLFGPT